MMKVFQSPDISNLLISRKGRFFIKDKNNSVDEIEIPNYLKSIFAKLMLNTFIGPVNGDIIYIDDDVENISLSNLQYQIELFEKTEEILIINGDDYKRIPEYPNYFISKYGVVFSNETRKFLKIKINRQGYYTIGITNLKGKRHFEMIHRLVYSTWVGKIPFGMEINHKNSKPYCNHLSNLELIESLDNIRYSIKYNNRYSKWNKEQVYDICECISKGLRPDEIYEKMKLNEFISKQNFRSFCNYLKNKKKFWKDISSKFDFSNAYSPVVKYDDNLIKAVLERLNEGISQKEIAEEFDIDFRVVSDIKRGVKKVKNTAA